MMDLFLSDGSGLWNRTLSLSYLFKVYDFLGLGLFVFQTCRGMTRWEVCCSR